MNRVLLFLTISSSLFYAAACGQFTPGQPHVEEQPAGKPLPPPPIVPLEPLAEKPDLELQKQIAEIAEDAEGTVGVGAVMLETGDSVWLNRKGQFASQSVYKLPIAMAVLRMVDEGKTRLDGDVIIRPDDYVRRGFHSPIRNLNPQGTVMPLNEVVRYSISESDGSASDVLLDLAGGPLAVQQYLSSVGIKDFIVADSEKLISKDWETQFRNWATPEDSINLLRTIQQNRAGLSQATTSLLLQFMTDSDTGHRRLKRGIPAGATLAHKTGTGGTEAEIPKSNANVVRQTPTPTPTPKPRPTPKPTPDRDKRDPADHRVTSATNDIGIITLPDGRHILIAVYIQNSTAGGWIRERVIADIAKAVCDKWFGVIPQNQSNVATRSNATSVLRTP